METTNIDHVEFYVADARLFSFYLRAGFGFQLAGQAGPGGGSVLLCQGGIKLVVTSAGGTGPVREFTGRHGDGVAVIGLGVDDNRAAFARAVAAGAVAVTEPAEHRDDDGRVVSAELAGPAGLRYRLVERHGTRSLPGFPALPEEAGEDGLLELIDHAAICVPVGELESSVRWYEEVFGLRLIFQERIEVGDQAMNSKVVQSPSGGVTFTLLEPDTTCAPGQIDGYLARNAGAGVQHLAFLVRDIISAVDRFQHKGVPFLRTPDSYYDQLTARLGEPEVKLDELRRVGVLADRDHWGEIFQIFAQPATTRDTYFTEIIERRGARTFGTGNIKALYEAVLRDQKM